MERPYFKQLENLAEGSVLRLEEIIEKLAFDERGLLPVITQDADSKNVLMFAWMNEEALQHTLATNRMTYWSRSRKQLWVKGETSGHTQSLVGMFFDCDGDVVLCQVRQTGAACHTGRLDCFYLKVDLEEKCVRIWQDTKN